MDFQTYHSYQRLVRRGKADPLLCTCGHEVVVVIGEGDEPVFQCYWCNTLTVPGQNTEDAVREKVENG